MTNEKSSPRPVRFDKVDDDEISELSRRTGFDRSQIIRAAVKYFLAEYRRTKKLPVAGDEPNEKSATAPYALPDDTVSTEEQRRIMQLNQGPVSYKKPRRRKGQRVEGTDD